MLNTNHEIVAKPLKMIKLNYTRLIDDNVDRLATIIKQTDPFVIPYTTLAVTPAGKLLINDNEISKYNALGIFAPANMTADKLYINLNTTANNIALNLLLAYTILLQKYYLIEQNATNADLNQISANYYLFTPKAYVDWIVRQPAAIGKSKDKNDTAYAAPALPYFAKALLTLSNLDQLLKQTDFLASIVYTFYIANDIDYYPVSQWSSDLYLKTLIAKINQQVAGLDQSPFDETISLWHSCMALYRK